MSSWQFVQLYFVNKSAIVVILIILNSQNFLKLSVNFAEFWKKEYYAPA
ncbi:hypothetical protein DOY81_002339, partial [Sarcophaga bullata]